jgi:hypothetical protein
MWGLIGEGAGDAAPFFLGAYWERLNLQSGLSEFSFTNISDQQVGDEVNVVSHLIDLGIDVVQAINARINLAKHTEIVTAMLVDLAVEDSAKQTNSFVSFSQCSRYTLALLASIEGAIVLLQFP